MKSKIAESTNTYNIDAATIAQHDKKKFDSAIYVNFNPQSQINFTGLINNPVKI
jgi:hypothetical protein